MRFRLALLAAVVPMSLVACGSDSGSDASSDTTAVAASGGGSELHVVASTTWTGALAALAGATDIDVIAPTSVLHPPDYDPKPSDLAVAADADFVVYAEFESFATRLTEAAGSKPTKFPITLENSTTMIEQEVLRLGEALGTADTARKNLDELLPKLTELGKDAATHVPDPAPVVVSQVFMSYWGDWAGLTRAGTYGPNPMSAGDLAKLMELAPTLILDNHHMPGGQAFEAEGIPRLELINYPGEDLDLLAVFQHNHDLIVDGLEGKVSADPNVSVPAGGGGHGHGDATTDTGAHGHGDSSTETTAGAHGHGDSSTETTAGAHGDASHSHGDATTDTSGHGG